METKDLPSLILILFMSAMILGVGILTLGKFGNTVREPFQVVDEQVTLTAGVGQLAYVDILSVDSTLRNATAYGDNYTITIPSNLTTLGVLTLTDAAGKDGVWNFTYSYDKDSNASVSTNYVVRALNPIASDWMPLIVTVAVLGIILGLVMVAFETSGKR